MAQARMSRSSFLQACHSLTGSAGSALWVHFQSAMQAVLSAGYSQQQSLRMFVAVDRRAKGVDVALAETSLLL